MKPGQRRHLARMFDAQNGICCYCDGATWLPGRESKIEAKARLGIQQGVNAGTKMLRLAAATREHLKRRVDGGRNMNNLTMACAACNSLRLDSTPEVHRVDMQVLVAAGLHPVNRPTLIDDPKAHIKRGLKALKKLRAGQPIQ